MHPVRVTQTPQQKRRIVGVLIGIPAFLVAWSLLVETDDSDEAPALAPAGSGDSETHQVVYEIDGQAIEASVTLSTPTGTQQIDANARLAGDDLHQMTVEPGEFLYISAQNRNELGTIVCRIIVDGVVIAENESTESYGIASCEGSAS